MKFSWRIFIATFLIIIFSFGVGGFILINYVFQSSLNVVLSSAVSENEMVCTSLNTVMTGTESSLADYTFNSFIAQLSENNRVITDGITSLKFYSENHFANSLGIGEQGYIVFSADNGRKYVQAVSHLDINDREIYVETLADITDTFNNRDDQYGLYRVVLLCVALFSSVVLWIFAHYITKPLKVLSNTAREIAGGKYNMRVPLIKHGSSEEVDALSENFNIMAQNVEDNINRLKDEARRQEDFVGNFTHELKTPLTSIIGYADMLRSVELPADERRMSAEYIYREGKRLESLSLHLLNMIVVRNTEAEMSNINTGSFFVDIEKSLRFTMAKYGLSLTVNADEAEVIMEPMLIKTVILNLAENGCKASSRGASIEITGRLNGDKYIITVTDHGKGIPRGEIPKIIEPFYMIDKSRARKSGSSGLGLALCSEILKLHNTALCIKSEVGEGTAISFGLEVKNEEGY